MKYFVCPCIFEVKLGCDIVKIDRLIEEGFIDSNYLAFLNNECCYICCKQSIEFLFDCSCSYHVQYTCGSICCIDLIAFGSKDLCLKCETFFVLLF